MKSKVRRILAAFLSIVILMTAPYIQTLAATWGSGDSVYAAMLDNYSGYDNSPYGDKRNYKYIIYNSSGTTSVGNRTASNHAKLGISKNGIIQQAICIEAGVSYSTNSTYTGVSSSSSDYMSRLPDNVQYMLKLALLCGFNSDTTSSPISRTNLDDFSFATQVIVWEIQQQLRTGYNPGDLKSNSVGTPAKVFYEQLQGRPAEKCYNHILSKMKNYATIPSFTSSASASAPTHLMKYNSSNKTYSVTLTDNTNSGIPVSAFNISGITVTKNGNKYTFSTSTKFTGTKSCTYKANRTNGDSLVIWKSNSNYQTMAAGIDDPVKFYANFKIENSGTIKINKNWVHNNDNSSTKGTYNSAYFTIKNSSGTIIKATGSAGSYSYSSSGSVTKLKLNSSNTLTISGLPTDTYTVYEYGYGDNDAIPYYTRNSGYLTANVSAGSTSSLTFTNTRNVGALKVNKTWTHNKAQTANYDDVYFTIINSSGDYVKASGNAGNYTYSSVSTSAGTKFKLNSSNTFSISKLPTGTYTVYEYGSDGGGIPGYTRTSGYKSTSISKGNTSTITFNNVRNLGTGVIAKTWSGSPTASEKATLNAAVSFYIVDNNSGKFVTATGEAGSYDFNGLTTSTPPQFFYLDSSTGKLTITNLPTGEYKVYEASRPAGYNPDTNPLTMTVSKGKTSTVTFNNSAGTGTGKIVKSWEDAKLTTSQRTTLNADIKFLIRNVSENKYITGTGSSGSYTFSGYSGQAGPTYFSINTSTSTLTISNLPAGEYEVIETSRPTGYQPKDNHGIKGFTIKANTTTSVTITNYNANGTGTAKVQKKWVSTSTLSTSEITNLEANVYFTVKNSKGNYVLASADSSGAYTYRSTSSTQAAKYRLSSSTFSISGLPTGTYTITEFCSADGYNSYNASKSTVPTEKTKTISVVNGATSSVAFTNIKTPVLKVRKHLSDEANLTDEEKKTEYAKISFKVMCLGTDGSETGTGPNGLYVTATGSDGYYTCTGLTTTGTTFYLKDDGSAEIDMMWNNQTPYYYKVIEYYDGTEYSLDTEEKTVIFSDGNPNTMLEVEEVVFNNTLKPGNLEVSKNFLGPDGTEDSPTETQIANIKFKIKNKDGKYLTFTGSNGNYTYSGVNTTGTELSLNSNKKLFANGLPARQTYYISEIQGTEGYNYSADSVEFTILPNETTDDVTFVNEAQSGTLKIAKHSADNNLGGWLFRVKLVDSIFANYTFDEVFETDINGLININNLRIGTYEVSEVTDNIKGYFTPEAQTVQITAGNTVSTDMTNIPYGSVHVTKVDKDYVNDKLTGAVFKVYNSTKSTIIGTLTEISTGEYQLDNLPFGNYYLRETTAPANYVPNTSTYYAFSISEAGQIVTIGTAEGLGFENTPRTGTLKIQKQSADGILNGWKFRVKLVKSPFTEYTYDETFTTDANGLITISNLRIGTYEVSEVITDVSGYTTPAAQTVEVKYNTTSTVNMKNTPYGSVHVTKVDKDFPSVKLSGAVFNVYNSSKTTVVGTLTEISTGEYQLDKIPYGNYYLREMTSPENYVPNTGTYYAFSITEAGQLVTVETKTGVGFENTAKTGTLKIQKASADGILNGWKFRVKLVTSPFTGYTYDKTFTTDANGLINISNLRIGTYKVSEVTTGITGYTTPAAQTVEVKYNTTSTVNMKNTPYGSVHITKVDKDFPNVKLSGAVFKVYNENKTGVVGTLTEISTGEYQLDNLPYGNYNLLETTSPTNYIPNNSTFYPFSITEAGQLVTVETKTGVGFENTAKTGTLKIQKASADGVLSGWKFRVKLTSSQFDGYTYDKTFTTDANGLITISNLRIGTYQVSEVTTGITGYVTPAAQTVEVKYNTTSTVNMTNTPYGSVHVTKVDKDYPNVKLTGAVFKVYASNKSTVIGTLTEISTGEYQLNNIPYGSYYLKETSAPANYYVDSTYYAFSISTAGSVVNVETKTGVGFENKAQGGAIKIVKHSADNVLNGWKFRIQLVESPFESYTYDKTLTTDSNGLISISGLRVGKYKVSEVTTGVTGYITPEAQTIEVTAGNSVTVEMTNIPCGSVHTTKVDKDYPNVKLTGAVFKVYTSDKSSIIGTLSEISTGEYQLDGIPQGSYYLKEVTAPTNYYVDSTFYTFTINAAGEVAVVETTEGIGFENKAQGGAIKVVKHSADNVLSGWKFRIQLVESPFDNYTYDKSFTTNTNGIISISGLRIGKYKVSEVTTGVTDYITPEAQTVEVTTGSTITAEMTNIPCGTISLTKVDSQNTSKKLSGAKFVVYKDTNSNGTYESSVDTEYKDLIDNSDGTYSLDKVPYGKYLVKEVLAPTGYCIDNHYYSIFIDGAGAIGQVNNSDDGLFHNEPVTGSVKLTKVDADYPDIKLAGAEFTVYASDKTTVIGVLTETEKGIYRLDGLSYGEYYLKETKAPEYFVLDENYYYFQIANANETIDMNNSGYGEGVFINSPQSGTIKIVKTSADGNVEGLSFLVTGTISTGEEYNETFITDENGIIIIDNLRAGEYTIRELNSDISAGKELSAEYSVTVKNEHIN